MLADFVASHPEAILSDELPREALIAIYDVVKALDRSLGKQKRRKIHWERVRQNYFLNCIVNTYKRNLSNSDFRFCNKTPLMERMYRKICSCCKEHRPLFIYCARHPKKVITSLMNMPWNKRDVPGNVHKLYRSLHFLKKIQNDSAVDVYVAQIDKISTSKEDRLNFAASLMAFLQLDMHDAVERYAEEWPVAQPTKHVLKGAAKRHLAEQESTFLQSSDKYLEICQYFDYEPCETASNSERSAV